MFNLTHCIMCTTHDRLTAFWAKPWMTSLTQLFVFVELRYTFKYWYRKITEQRQDVAIANSDRYTNEDAEIILIGHRPIKVLHSSAWHGRCSKEGSKGMQCPGDVCPDGGGRLLIQQWSIAAGQSRVSTCGTDGKLLMTLGYCSSPKCSNLSVNSYSDGNIWVLLYFTFWRIFCPIIRDRIGLKRLGFSGLKR